MFDSKTWVDYNQYIGRRASLFLILSLLDRDKEHSGYSLIKTIKSLTEGKLTFRAGTIYPQFEKLTKEGLIEKHVRDSPSRSRDVIRQKAVYSITAEGTKALARMREDWKDLRLLIDKIGLGLMDWDE
ncbi:MAG: PadR family transcriptional regulator [Candidatus Hodarchaeales archaeon]|jgi:DNA-binding PadR family transcriptional regulator